jgi:hypothetical protein
MGLHPGRQAWDGMSPILEQQVSVRPAEHATVRCGTQTRQGLPFSVRQLSALVLVKEACQLALLR